MTLLDSFHNVIKLNETARRKRHYKIDLLRYMEQLFLFAIFTTLLFVVLKLTEMKYLEKEIKPLKYIVRDAVIVGSSAFAAAAGVFYMKSSFTDFLNVVTENKVFQPDTTQIFTDAPGF